MDVPPDGEMDDALPVRDHHDAGFEIERHERLQDAGYGEHRQRTRHVGLVLQHQLPVAVVSQRTGLEHRRESDLGQGGTQRRLVVHGGVQGRPQPVGAGIVLLAQAILRIVERAETLRDVVFLFQRDQHAARDVFEFVGHHIAAAAKLFERRGIVIRRHDVPVAQRERGGVGRRVEAQRARPEQVRLLDDHQPQLTAADDTDRFRRLCHSRLPCRIKVLPPVRRRAGSHGTLRAGQPAPHPAVRGSTRLSAPRSSPR